jgi:hypothetical protein
MRVLRNTQSMSTQITYFVHSTTADNQNGISSGWNDLPLSAIGIQQSHELREALQGEDHLMSLSRQISSERDKRSQIVFPDHPHVVYDARLRECNYGDMNGQPAGIVEPLQELNMAAPFPNGESYEDVLNREYENSSKIVRLRISRKISRFRQLKGTTTLPRCHAQGQHLGGSICQWLEKDKKLASGVEISGGWECCIKKN